ncbi:MAG TPA: hypothetical protein VNA27_10760 [Rubrobacteraceae bacterium]|nr:hypothetical protein [Rubrobacteraceae bacterium]
MDFLIPSEAISPFAGYLVSRGEMSLFATVAAGVLGNLVGSWIAYFTSSTSGTGGSCGPTTGATSGCAPAPAA